jgi:hypothetical protein
LPHTLAEPQNIKPDQSTLTIKIASFASMKFIFAAVILFKNSTNRAENTNTTGLTLTGQYYIQLKEVVSKKRRNRYTGIDGNALINHLKGVFHHRRNLS